mmetsp:Transcript_16566/g.57124  ORF Transcript_16566/g.57124 Transcript_16566/m.57124 type:complete len:92 (-) Transcript_16566:35-310(-)
MRAPRDSITAIISDVIIESSSKLKIWVINIKDQNQEGPHQETLISIWTPPSKIMSKWTSLQNKISKGTSPSTIFDHHYLEFNVPSYRRVFP